MQSSDIHQDSLSYGVTIIEPTLSSLIYLFDFTEAKPAAAAKSKAVPKAKPASKASPPDKKSRKKAVFSDSDDDDVVQFSPEKSTGKKVGALGVLRQMYVLWWRDNLIRHPGPAWPRIARAGIRGEGFLPLAEWKKPWL